MHPTDPKPLARILAAVGTLLSLIAAPAIAQEVPAETDREVVRQCVRVCLETRSECMDEVHAVAALCIENAGCESLQQAVVDACRGESRDRDACRAARDARDVCTADCGEASREDAGACRADVIACASESCGVEIPAGHIGRGGRGGRGGCRGGARPGGRPGGGRPHDGHAGPDSSTF